ncbi:hypothetical protein GYA19_04085 [Candidatus Beckwithbacteria bacterium]|nr:hypothetical protein [Candidatus Beckwithbacteria bacterium]
MKTAISFFLIIVIISFTLLTIRFVFGGDEDTWVCQNGQWERHGNPSAPKPSSLCK